MKGYGQFCPVAVASEVFAQRWTPLIIRELCSGRSHFNEIHRGIPLISRTLLAERLRWLESAGVVASSAARAGRVREYRLTEAGKQDIDSICEVLDRYPELRSSRVQLQPPPGSTTRVRFFQCRAY